MHRLKILRVSPEFIVEMCKSGITKFDVTNPLPDDAVFIRTFIDDSSGWGKIGLVVRSSHFPDLDEGERIPEIQPEFFKVR